MNKRCIFLSFALGSLAMPAQAESLGEAIATAYETNPELAAARANYDALEELPIQARAEGMPSLDAKIDSGYDKHGAGSNGQASLNARWPIWTGGRVSAATHAAESTVAAGAQDLRDSEAGMIERIVSAYASLLLSQKSLEIAQIGIGRLDSQIAEAQLRFDLGRATLTDVAQLKAQRASVSENLAIAENDLAGAKAAYLALVGKDAGALAETNPPPQGLPLSRDEAREQALNANPLLLRERQSLDASLYKVAEAKAEHAPTLELGTTYGRALQRSAGTWNEAENAANFGVTLRVPLLSGGLVSSKVRYASDLYRAKQYSLAAMERETIRQSDVAWSGLITAKARLATNEERVKSAELALKGILLEYNLARRSTLDILIADDALRSAQIALAASHADILVAEARLLRATGQLERGSYQ